MYVCMYGPGQERDRECLGSRVLVGSMAGILRGFVS